MLHPCDGDTVLHDYVELASLADFIDIE